MPAQQLSDRSSKGVMGLPANSSTAALMKKMNKVNGGLDVEFRAGGGGGHVTSRQWITVFVLVYVNLINYMDRLTIAGILEDIQTDFNANNAMMGLLQTAFIVSFMIFAPLFGYLGDRYSRKAIMAFGVFLWSIFTLIGSFIGGKAENRHLEWSNPDYWSFLACRAMVGIGEASYSTIAPTIISDMFVKNMRSKMLALFYFAIPVGSGLGYIISSKTAAYFGHWQWGLRATPVAGAVAVIGIVVFMMDPPRGESEGHQDMKAQSYKEDLISLAKNKSFVFSTLAFTCVTFVTGALSWWGPKFIEDGLQTLNEGDRGVEIKQVSFIFGVVMMMSGIVGVPLGMTLSTQLKSKYPRADPIICAGGLLASSLFLCVGLVFVTINIYVCFLFIFLGSVALNLNWSIIADMLLYIVTPTCRSTAEAIQILASHAFGDAGSPYLIGLVSDGLFEFLKNSSTVCVTAAFANVNNVNQTVAVGTIVDSIEADLSQQISEYSLEEGLDGEECVDEVYFKYQSMQYSLFTNFGVEIIGGVLFFITAIFIVRDKLKCENASAEMKLKSDGGCGTRLMMTPTNYSPEDSLAEDLPSDDDELPRLKLLVTDEISSSRSPSP